MFRKYAATAAAVHSGSGVSDFIIPQQTYIGCVGCLSGFESRNKFGRNENAQLDGIFPIFHGLGWDLRLNLDSNTKNATQIAGIFKRVVDQDKFFIIIIDEDVTYYSLIIEL